MARAEPTDVMFYHLERQPLDKALPKMLEMTLQRGWKAVVQAGSEERLEALDTLLWTYTDESFLPHGTVKDGNASMQPIFLTVGDDNPAGADVRFMVDGALGPSNFDPYLRVVYLFDGRDAEAVAAARGQWKAAKSAGCSVTYWQQTDAGRWERKA
jgi:DNA polymerase-3 subunit chi